MTSSGSSTRGSRPSNHRAEWLPAARQAMASPGLHDRRRRRHPVRGRLSVRARRRRARRLQAARCLRLLPAPRTSRRLHSRGARGRRAPRDQARSQARRRRQRGGRRLPPLEALCEDRPEVRAARDHPPNSASWTRICRERTTARATQRRRDSRNPQSRRSWRTGSRRPGARRTTGRSRRRRAWSAT